MSDFLLQLLSSIASRIAADEAKEWMPRIANRLIHWAALQFPPDLRDRYEEEWLAHARDLPGCCAKLWHALGCVSTATEVTSVVAKTAIRFVAILT